MDRKIIIADIKSFSKDGKHSKGHFVPVARNYVEMFGEKCVVAGGSVITDRFMGHDIIKLPYCISSPGVLSKLQTMINSIVLFKRSRGNIIVLQQSTAITAFFCIALFFWCSSRLFLIAYDTKPLESRIGRFLYSFAKKKISGVVCSSDRVGKAYGCPYYVVTDYTFTKDIDTLSLLPYESREYDFCFIGGIYASKGHVEALSALANKGFKVLVAGSCNEPGLKEKLDAIADLDPDIKMNIGYVSDDDYDRYIRSSKYCVLNYSGTYNDRSSGVVLDIIFRGTPVIGNRCSALDLVNDNELGCLYDDVSTFDWQAALDESLFNACVANIKTFLLHQKEMIEKLSDFCVSK